MGYDLLSQPRMESHDVDPDRVNPADWQMLFPWSMRGVAAVPMVFVP